MTEILAVKEKPKYTNALLRSATDRVFRIGETVRKCAFETAAIMANVDRLECYKDDGFSSVHEWAMSTFGFKKSTSYNLLRIGNEYTRAIEHGKSTIYESNLLPEGSPLDFTASQIEKMLPVGHKTASELVESGEITPIMTCKAIENAIKAHTADEGEDESVDEGEGEAVSENESADVVIIRVTDANGIIYDVPEDVLKQYQV